MSDVPKLTLKFEEGVSLTISSTYITQAELLGEIARILEATLQKQISRNRKGRFFGAPISVTVSEPPPEPSDV